MKKRKKIILGSITGALALALAGGGFWAYKTFVPQETPIDKNATVASNFYQAVNKDWLLKTKIPADSPSIDNFYTLDEDIKGKLKKDIKNLGEGKETSDITGMSEFITFYKAASDYKQREKDGLEPLKPYLKEIEDIKDLNDLASKSASLTDKGIPLPFGYDVGTNAENTSQKQIQLSPPSILLPDVSIYKDEASKKQYLTPIETATQKALEMLGYSEKNSKRIVKEALEFDEIIAKYSLSNEEMSESKNLVHPKTAEEINACPGSFKLYDVIKGIMGRDLETINVPNTKYFENYSKIVNQDNFSKIKSWMLVQEAMAASNSLTEDYRLNFESISMAIMGTQKPVSKEDTVYEMSVHLFSDVMSVYYGRKYFGEEAKTDVTGMIDKIKNVYRGRLQKNNWLTEGTRNKAIEKLDKMKVFVGYQEAHPAFAHSDQSFLRRARKLRCNMPVPCCVLSLFFCVIQTWYPAFGNIQHGLHLPCIPAFHLYYVESCIPVRSLSEESPDKNRPNFHLRAYRRQHPPAHPVRLKEHTLPAMYYLRMVFRFE